ncbi:MAG: chromate efflux transporter [Candidatus Limnocylindrales bacterium]|jgi:chromate transporter
MGQSLTRAGGDWREVLAVFLRLGLTAFGGPAAHTGLFRETLVRRRGWLSDDDFMDLVAATSTIPGPNSSELALAIGRRRAGWPGFAAAGIGFILPAVVISIVLAWLAVGAASVEVMAAVLAGIDPVVVAILVVSVAGLAWVMVGDRIRLAVAGLAMLAYLAGLPEIAILAGGAAIVLVWRAARPPRPVSSLDDPIVDEVPGATEGEPPSQTGLRGFVAPGAWWLATASSASTVVIGLAPIFLVFLKAGALLFGSGYVLVALLRADLVVDLGWITERQLLDAIAVGQATPGPLTSSAGYIGFLLAGVPGALVATAGIYLPALILVGLLEPIVQAVKTRPTAAAALAGAGAGALGLLAGVTIELARAALLPAGSPAPVPIVVAGVATVALASGRVGPTILILLGGLIGMVRVFVVG